MMMKELSEYPVIQVANTFLYSYFEADKEITNLKLQKLVYLAYAHYLTIKHKRLIKEHFEAWVYGPVVPELYESLKKYGAERIKHYINSDNNAVRPNLTLIEENSVKSFISFVYDAYDGYGARDLVLLTHAKGGAWAKTFTRSKAPKKIEDRLIKEEYKNKELALKTEEYSQIAGQA